MDFNQFEKQIVKIKKMDLPGEDIQFKMAPMGRLKELKEAAINMQNARKAATLALFYPTFENKTNLILILRKTYKGVHSAQVGFPGGKIEPGDKTMIETALRETEEEIGVSREDVEILGELTEVYIPPSNFFVQPYVGITKTTPVFVGEEKEVEALIEVNLDDFLDDDCLTTEILSTSYLEKLEVPAFRLNDNIVWGATAMILSELREMLFDIL